MGLCVMTLLSQLAYAHGMSEVDKQAIIDGGNWRYLWIGATHMLSGYDHLAFVFGIIFFLKSFRDIVKYVTAFTVGHSLTLMAATFYAIQLNYILIDAVIALSVCYIAFANLDGFRKYLKVNPPNMLLMIIALGLIHGFGLSTRLQELPLSTDGLLLNIIAFNIGIELGQLLALFAMLLLIATWRNRKSFKAFSLIANYGLILTGMFLFLMQMHDYSHELKNAMPVLTPQARLAVPSQVVSQEEHISVTVPARGNIEYKVYMAKDAMLEYTWSTSGSALFFDFHGEPKGDSTGYFKSYQKDTRMQATGSLHAPFAGTHGWYWKNKSDQVVTIHLLLKGDYQLIAKKMLASDFEDLDF